MWEHGLTQIEKDPLGLDREVDWVIKYKLIEAYREQARPARSTTRGCRCSTSSTTTSTATAASSTRCRTGAWSSGSCDDAEIDEADRHAAPDHPGPAAGRVHPQGQGAQARLHGRLGAPEAQRPGPAHRALQGPVPLARRAGREAHRFAVGIHGPVRQARTAAEPHGRAARRRAAAHRRRDRRARHRLRRGPGGLPAHLRARQGRAAPARACPSRSDAIPGIVPAESTATASTAPTTTSPIPGLAPDELAALRLALQAVRVASRAATAPRRLWKLGGAVDADARARRRSGRADAVASLPPDPSLVPAVQRRARAPRRPLRLRLVRRRRRAGRRALAPRLPPGPLVPHRPRPRPGRGAQLPPRPHPTARSPSTSPAPSPARRRARPRSPTSRGVYGDGEPVTAGPARRRRPGPLGRSTSSAPTSVIGRPRPTARPPSRCRSHRGRRSARSCSASSTTPRCWSRPICAPTSWRGSPAWPGRGDEPAPHRPGAPAPDAGHRPVGRRPARRRHRSTRSAAASTSSPTSSRPASTPCSWSACTRTPPTPSSTSIVDHDRVQIHLPDFFRRPLRLTPAQALRPAGRRPQPPVGARRRRVGPARPGPGQAGRHARHGVLGGRRGRPRGGRRRRPGPAAAGGGRAAAASRSTTTATAATPRRSGGSIRGGCRPTRASGTSRPGAIAARPSGSSGSTASARSPCSTTPSSAPAAASPLEVFRPTADDPRIVLDLAPARRLGGRAVPRRGGRGAPRRPAAGHAGHRRRALARTAAPAPRSRRRRGRRPGRAGRGRRGRGPPRPRTLRALGWPSPARRAPTRPRATSDRTAGPPAGPAPGERAHRTGGRSGGGDVVAPDRHGRGRRQEAQVGGGEHDRVGAGHRRGGPAGRHRQDGRCSRPSTSRRSRCTRPSRRATGCW